MGVNLPYRTTELVLCPGRCVMTGTQLYWLRLAVILVLFLLANGLILLFLTMCGTTVGRWLIRFVKDAWGSGDG